MPNFNFKEMLKNELSRVIDNLNRLIFILWLISFIVSLFIKNLWADLLPIVLAVVFIFRLVSKNKYKRQKENERYLKIKKFIFKPFDILSRNIKDKDHVYCRCHKCKKILKLPLPDNSGFQHAKCPTCGKRVTFYTTKKVKIELIKKKKD